jgi:G3E family GTPase
VAFADKILLNKIDLVNAQEKASVLNSIRSINAVAQVMETTQSRANLDQVPRTLASSFRVAATLSAFDPCRWCRLKAPHASRCVSSNYWTVYKKFASQSQHKYKILIFFFRRSKRQRNFSLFYFAS